MSLFFEYDRGNYYALAYPSKNFARLNMNLLDFTNDILMNILRWQRPISILEVCRVLRDRVFMIAASTAQNPTTEWKREDGKTMVVDPSAERVSTVDVTTYSDVLVTITKNAKLIARMERKWILEEGRNEDGFPFKEKRFYRIYNAIVLDNELSQKIPSFQVLWSWSQGRYENRVDVVINEIKYTAEGLWDRNSDDPSVATTIVPQDGQCIENAESICEELFKIPILEFCAASWSINDAINDMQDREVLFRDFHM